MLKDGSDPPITRFRRGASRELSPREDVNSDRQLPPFFYLSIFFLTASPY